MPNQSPPERLAYTVQQAADAVGMSHMTIRRAIANGQLIAQHPTSRALILHADLMRWLTTDRQTA